MYQKDTSKNSETPCKHWTFQHLQEVPVGGEGEILSTGSARLCTSKTQSQQHCERRRRAAAPCFVTKSRSLHLPQAAVALFAHAPPQRSVQISPYFSAVTEKAKRHSIRVPFLCPRHIKKIFWRLQSRELNSRIPQQRLTSILNVHL